MSKKDQILANGNGDTTYYDLNKEELMEVASLIALMDQARAAQDFIYSRIVQNIADRYEITGKEITLNFEEIMEKGAKEAKLVVRG